MRIAALSLFLSVAAHADPSVHAAPSVDVGSGCARLPESWQLDESMATALARDERAGSTLRVLAWQVEEDRIRRPLQAPRTRERRQRALAWIARGDHTWILANLIRDPNRAERWHRFTVEDTPIDGIRSFDARPTRAELDQFLKDTRWGFQAGEPFLRIVDREVCTQAWWLSFGQKPWRAYPPMN